jgi:hypothetical protein
MTRYTFGGTAADIVTDTAGNYTTDAGTAWTSRVGGTQVTDLLDTNGNPLVGGTISTLTDPVGLVIFQGPGQDDRLGREGRPRRLGLHRDRGHP